MVGSEPQKTAVADEQVEQPGWQKSWPIVGWVVAIVLGSVVVHAVLFFMLQKSPQPPAPVELEVGSFDFVAAREAATDIDPQPAKFDIHVRFVDDLEQPGRELLAAHRNRVREAIENLLRKSQQVELGEPGMARLKHEIQQRVDDALDLHAVAEVIITNLKIEPMNRAGAAAVSDGAMPAARKSVEPTAVRSSID